MKFLIRACELKYLVLCASVSVIAFGCNRTASIPMSVDTLHPVPDSFGLKAPVVETTLVTGDTNVPALPPIARAIDPTQLATFLPPMTGWKAFGELEKELSVHDSVNLSRVWQSYIMGGDTVTIQINDFAYVPSLYMPYQKYKGTYLEDNNNERVETTNISGFQAAQTVEKKSMHTELLVFPGNRYVVVMTESGSNDINDLRRVAQAMNLKGLQALQ